MEQIINSILTIIIGIIMGHNLSLFCLDKVSIVDR